MSFSNLYRASVSHFRAAAQQSSPVFFPVRNIVEQLILQNSWLSEVHFTPVSVLEGDPLGHIEVYAQDGYADVFHSSAMNDCYKRFVWAKELMHLFDTEEAQTKNRQKFIQLATEIEHEPIEKSEMFRSENLTKWMALLVLCPRSERDRVIERVEKGESHFSVASDYMIPEDYVGNLLSKYYEQAFDLLID